MKTPAKTPNAGDVASAICVAAADQPDPIGLVGPQPRSPRPCGAVFASGAERAELLLAERRKARRR